MLTLLRIVKPGLGLLGVLFAMPGLAASERLVLNAEATYPAVMVENGRVTGHAAEKIHEIMRRTGADYSIALLPWKRAYLLALSQASTCVFMTARTAEREALFKWIGPISQTDWVLYGRASRTFGIKTLDDAKGLRIGGYNGDVRGEYLAARGYLVDFVQNDESNPKKLMLDRIDLWVNSTRSSRPLLAKLGLTGKIVPLVTFQRAKLYLACHLSVADTTVARMEAALKAMETDGAYKAIEHKFDSLFPANALKK